MICSTWDFLGKELLVLEEDVDDSSFRFILGKELFVLEKGVSEAPSGPKASTEKAENETTVESNKNFSIKKTINNINNK